jgi:hypothetical protein
MTNFFQFKKISLPKTVGNHPKKREIGTTAIEWNVCKLVTYSEKSYN